jgi:hypothetical protein
MIILAKKHSQRTYIKVAKYIHLVHYIDAAKEPVLVFYQTSVAVSRTIS